MPNYRRVSIAGATYFFTVALAYRASRILVERVDDLRRAVADVRTDLPFRVAAVILPDHLHMFWTLPAGDADFSTRWKRIKTGFTKAVGAPGDGARARSPRARRGSGSAASGST